GRSRNASKPLNYSLYSYYPVQNTCGEMIGVNVAVRDITRRNQAESDTIFFLDLGEAIRFAADGDELLWSVAVALGEHLRMSRCAFFEVSGEDGRPVLRRDYHRHLPSLVGSSLAGAVATLIREPVGAGRVV